MPVPPDPHAGRRLALIVATSTYGDRALAQLRAPGHDATQLADVLEESRIGGLAVTLLRDAPAEQVRRAVAEFGAAAGPGDLVLMYLSCHGVLDDRGRL